MVIMVKILLLGKGVANNGCKRLLEDSSIDFDYFDKNEITEGEYDYIVKAPGIPLYDSCFKNIHGKVISDIELAYVLRRVYMIGVTGSNGKTTVCTMLYQILKHKYRVVLCGNIGYSICDAVVDNKDAEIFIVEMSSFQLEAINTLDCNISVLLNIDMCHLDHHLNMRNYVDAKLKLALKQSFNRYTIYNTDNVYLSGLHKMILSTPIGFSYNSTINRIYVLNDYIYFKNKRIFKLKKEDLKCRHKVENYLAVLSVISIMNFSMKKACKILKDFKDVEYRLNKIDKYVYNDAKSTNCASTNAAISSLDKIHLICGGYDRFMDIKIDDDNLKKLICVYAYGQTKDKIKNYFQNKNIRCLVFNTLEDALRSAYIKRIDNEIILYSPMFASYDQYHSYNERGKEFNELYFQLKNRL